MGCPTDHVRHTMLQLHRGAPLRAAAVAAPVGMTRDEARQKTRQLVYHLAHLHLRLIFSSKNTCAANFKT